jgi:hypothetical protein
MYMALLGLTNAENQWTMHCGVVKRSLGCDHLFVEPRKGRLMPFLGLFSTFYPPSSPRETRRTVPFWLPPDTAISNRISPRGVVPELCHPCLHCSSSSSSKPKFRRVRRSIPLSIPVP